MEPKVYTITTAVCVLLLQAFVAVAIPIAFNNTALSEPRNVSNSSELDDMELLLLENQDAPTEIRQQLVEGDIMTFDDSAKQSHEINKRGAPHDRSKRWPEGQVPYVIDDAYDATSRGKIATAFKAFERVSCIRFIQRTNQSDYIHILPRSGCWSYVGRTGGRQELSLNRTCLSSSGTIVVHELMHALGFGHEHNRPDRDEFVTIHWDNIEPGEMHNFEKHNRSALDPLTDTTYDLRSIMHFRRMAFSKNGEPTMLPHASGKTLGNRGGLSRTDKQELKLYYECSCKDRHSNCSQWAAEGKCITDGPYMLRQCMASCKICGPGSESSCTDKHQHCSVWKSRRFCGRKTVMRQCKRTCDLCASGEQD